jgi:hypothetical protein
VGRKESVLDVNPEELKAVVSLKAYRPGSREMVVHPRVQPLPQGVTATVGSVQVSLSQTEEPPPPRKKKK